MALAHCTAGPADRWREIAGRYDLTARETAVLTALLDGLTAAAIARRQQCSPRTVHKHVEHIYRKMGVHDRLEAARAVGELPPARRTGTRRRGHVRSLASAVPASP